MTFAYDFFQWHLFLLGGGLRVCLQFCIKVTDSLFIPLSDNANER